MSVRLFGIFFFLGGGESEGETHASGENKMEIHTRKTKLITKKEASTSCTFFMVALILFDGARFFWFRKKTHKEEKKMGFGSSCFFFLMFTAGAVGLVACQRGGACKPRNKTSLSLRLASPSSRGTAKNAIRRTRRTRRRILARGRTPTCCKSLCCKT